jgi:ketosteroid isomerase-like protein
MAENVGTAMTPERLAEFGEAWNHHDVELVMDYMAEECAYYASFGSSPAGESYVGRKAIREGVRRFFKAYPDGRFEDASVFVAGDRGVAEWTFVATRTDGSVMRTRGCDLLEFEGDMVKTKDAFRKQLQ